MKQLIIYLITLLLLMVVSVYLGYCIGYVLYFLHDLIGGANYYVW